MSNKAFAVLIGIIFITTVTLAFSNGCGVFNSGRFIVSFSCKG